ncbi:hypothetical protein [Streptomyces sp. WAC 01529]|uniref:hypothetical protein n=1 Tax=Streptomyces sp. WAC 01529 TaxID=2203205 RepID=UPI000F744143|nr:hypothetical protein [Streptomyces sp. WAC 01529]
MSALVLASLTFGAAPVAYAVDPIQEHRIANCYFDKSKRGAERQKYCKALEGKPMTKTAKNCLVRAGIGGAAALVVGKVNKKVAREIAVNVAGAGASACLSAFVK